MFISLTLHETDLNQSCFFRKLIPSGLTVTLLRDPVDTFESGYVYLGLQRGYKMDINQFAAKRARFGAKRFNLIEKSFCL